MANRTVTVTVASGTLYVVGGTSNSFYIDGTRPGDFTVDWVKDGTIRFEQSGSSNDGHPLIFSTSNSSTLGTMQAGIISSGVTYYLDGSSNQSDYTNTTTFNAATTRYIEIAPASQTDFYFACWIHGISMGGIMDITQNTWGASTWSTGGWEAQPDFTEQVTGQALTLSQGEETASGEVNEGWGRAGWDTASWGTYGTVVPTGEVLSTGLGSVSITTEVNTGWGRLTWGENVWDDYGDVILTGGSLATGIGSVAVSAEVNEGWGRQTWGYGVWGAGGIDVALTGQAMALALGNESAQIDVAVTAATQSLTVSLGTEVAGSSVDVPVTGQFMTTYLGSVNAHLWTEINPDVSMVWTEIAA